LQNNANIYNAKLDPAEAFLADVGLQAEAKNAKVPAGYTQVYSNLMKSAQANGYMGYVANVFNKITVFADSSSDTQ
jgi:hypothetical protein